MVEQIVDLVEAGMPVSSDTAAVAAGAGSAAGWEAGRMAASGLANGVAGRVSALESRVDVLSASGSGGGDEGKELRDVRAGWDGVTAATAGESVRRQARGLYDRAMVAPTGIDGYVAYNQDPEAPWDDLDTFRANTLVLVDNQKVAHLPAGLKLPTWVQTFGLPGHNDRLKYQMAFDYDGRVMFRSIHGAPDSTWAGWADTAVGVLSNPMVNGGLVMTAQGDFADADTVPRNSVLMVSDTTMSHLPAAQSGWLITLGVTNDTYMTGKLEGKLRSQLYVSEKGGVWTRSIHGAPDSTWAGWTQIGGSQRVLDQMLAGEYVDFGMFRTIACLGDSYTQGGIADSSGQWHDELARPWPQTVAERDGVTASNFGVGGSMTRTYFNDNLQRVLDATPSDAYFYCWGINDSYDNDYMNGRWDGLKPQARLGGPADIVANATSTPANTFYGYYSAIVRRCQAHAPLAAHTLIAPPTAAMRGGLVGAYADAVKDIAERLGLPFMDPRDDPFFKSPTFTSLNAGHPTRAGYIGMARAYTRLFSRCVDSNTAYYRDAVVGQGSEETTVNTQDAIGGGLSLPRLATAARRIDWTVAA